MFLRIIIIIIIIIINIIKYILVHVEAGFHMIVKFSVCHDHVVITWSKIFCDCNNHIIHFECC